MTADSIMYPSGSYYRYEFKTIGLYNNDSVRESYGMADNSWNVVRCILDMNIPAPPKNLNK